MRSSWMIYMCCRMSCRITLKRHGFIGRPAALPGLVVVSFLLPLLQLSSGKNPRNSISGTYPPPLPSLLHPITQARDFIPSRVFYIRVF